jgi:hypothetical protein
MPKQELKSKQERKDNGRPVDVVLWGICQIGYKWKDIWF